MKISKDELAVMTFQKHMDALQEMNTSNTEKKGTDFQFEMCVM